MRAYPRAPQMGQGSGGPPGRGLVQVAYVMGYKKT